MPKLILPWEQNRDRIGANGLLERYCRRCLKYKPAVEFRVVKTTERHLHGRIEPTVSGYIKKLRSLHCTHCEQK